MLSGFRDRLLQVQLRENERRVSILLIIIVIIITLISANVIYLNFNLLNRAATDIAINKIPPAISQISTISPTPCLNCLTPTLSPAPTPTLKIIQNITIQKPLVKEYFVPLGSGTNKTSEWIDVAEAQATIDFGQYPNIKEARFEASVNVPSASQIVYIRLFNVTDKHTVWNSEVITNGNSSSYLVSQPLIYDFGSKLYQVQMKSQLGALSNLTQSRVRILLK